MKTRCTPIRRQRGISLAEVLAAMVLILITVVPASEALRVALMASASGEARTVQDYRLRGKLEEVLAEPFALLRANAGGPGVPTVYSDAAGSDERRLVFIASYDIDNADADNDPFTGGEPDLLWIEVRTAGRGDALQTLTAEQ